MGNKYCMGTSSPVVGLGCNFLYPPGRNTGRNPGRHGYGKYLALY